MPPMRRGTPLGTGPTSVVTIQFAHWLSPHQINVCLADRYHVDRVFLAEECKPAQ